MKRLYSTILGLLTVAAASAALPVACQLKAVSTTASSSTPILVRSQHVEEAQTAMLGNAPAGVSKSTKALIDDIINQGWEEVGSSEFREGLIVSLYGVEDYISLTTNVYKSTATEGLYRADNPYKALADAHPTIFSYDAENAEPIYFQVVDGNKFYIKNFNSGLIDLEDNAPILVKSQAEGLIDGNGLDLVLSAVPGCFGEFENNVFKFSDPTFSLSGKTYYDILISISDGTYIGNKYGAFKLLLPGADDKDYSIAVKHASCADDNKFSLDFTLGADVETYSTMILSGEYSASEDNYSYVASKGQAWTKDQNSLSINLNGQKEGIWTLFAVTVDADNNVLNGIRSLFYVVNDNADQWKALEGKALFTDDIVASIYNKHDDTERSVTIEVNNETPGYYRLVNPYAAPYAFAAQSKHQGSHNHYLYINASNPEQVYVEEAPIGWELADGAMAVTSYAFQALSKGTDPAEITTFGKLDDRTITFPANALRARELNYDNARWYDANVNNAFKVVLPENAGVGNILSDSADDAPAELFNLQGQRVVNPAAGQLVIKRQGATVSKIFVK